MFRPQIQKTRFLVLIASITMLTIFWVSNSIELIPADDIKEKSLATEVMHEYLQVIKEIPGNNNNTEIDLYNSGLIGEAFSPITSIFESEDNQFLNSKIACTHPNFSALIVNLFDEAELNSGDTVAVHLTGSLPGANIAFLSACKALDITPVILSSLSSSSWGLNKPSMTWLDIESYLYNNKFTDFKSIAVSIGGEGDTGENLNDEGIEILEENIIANESILINEKNLESNINKKLRIYSNYMPVENYSAFINIGGNPSSIGPGAGKDTMKVGVVFPLEIMDIVDEHNSFVGSIAHKFLNNEVVFINIKNINILASQVGLYPPNISIEKNKGSLFYAEESYNILTILIALMINLVIISIVGVRSHNQIKRRMRNEEFDSIL